MADSQLMCLDDNHINVSINDKNAQFLYCELQRLALEELLESGATDFNKFIKEQGIKEFVSLKEVKKISKNWDKYRVEDTDSTQGKATEIEGSLTYWPEQSDTPIPELDLGWTEHVAYRGITRATIHMQPPKNNDPSIKEIVRKLIQEARKVIAVVMDDFTDRNIFEDMVEAGYRRRVAVYIVLDQGTVKEFLEMCRVTELNDLKIRNIRVRSIAGTGLYLTAGHVKGTLNQKFMIVDGDKALSGSYSFTWSSTRLHRSMLALFTGQILETLDTEFRELYANSESVNLHDHLNIPPAFRFPSSAQPSDPFPPRSNELKRKFNNPKYLLAMEGMRRAASDNLLSSTDGDKVPEQTLIHRERRVTMRDSKKEDESKSIQVVRDWLLANDVRGLDHPEPLEDLVPPSQMPNRSKQFGGKFKFPDFGRAISRRDRSSQSAGKASSGAEEENDMASRKGMKSKRKKEESVKGNRQEGELSEKGNAGKSSSSFLDRQVSTATTKSKKEKCRIS